MNSPGRRVVVAAAALTVMATGFVVTQPSVVSAAVDLITSKDIKDGTIKKRDLAPQVRQKLGVPGPAGPPDLPGPKVRRACRAATRPLTGRPW